MRSSCVRSPPSECPAVCVIDEPGTKLTEMSDLASENRSVDGGKPQLMSKNINTKLNSETDNGNRNGHKQNFETLQEAFSNATWP